MNKYFKYFLIIGGSLVIMWIAARLTNALQFFSAPTYSNYPTIQVGDLFFGSNLVKPKRFDLICYYATTPEFGKQIWVHRLCGQQGDTIEIVHGQLFVNNQLADAALTLAHNYKMHLGDYQKLQSLEKLDESMMQPLPVDTVMASVDDAAIKKHAIKAEKYVLSKDYADSYISQRFSAAWNQDNFGPVVVPAGKYFVLGDNRLNAQDSRYIGFIDQADYVATVLGK